MHVEPLTLAERQALAYQHLCRKLAKMVENPQRYRGRDGVLQHIEDLLRLHGPETLGINLKELP